MRKIAGMAITGPEQGTYFLGRLAAFLGADLLPYLGELRESGLVGEIEALVAGEPTWQTRSFGDIWTLRLYRIFLYAIVRARRPETMVETGVLHGLTTAFLLDAMERNQTGRLVSVDLPSRAESGPANQDGYTATLPPGRDPGWVVPERLRARWELHLGPSTELLPGLLAPESIDVFLHDSEHTYPTMLAEMELAWPALRPDGLLIVDNADDTDAVRDFCAAVGREALLLPTPDLNPSEALRCAVLRK